MTRKEEILDELVTLREALNTITDVNSKKSIQETIDKLEVEFAQVDPMTTPVPNQTAMPTSYSQAALATLRATMMGGQGSGVDSVQVRKIIEDYLITEKVNLAELDEDVTDLIKANQKVILEIPNFGGFKVEVTKRDSEIPYFYEVIDDVLAGNNVYLIGEAGGGKTYTAEEVAKKLKREYTIINCSQYTSPTEILGGQTINGYKEGKLINAWREGKILILDEMPRLDPNTAGLFNDALAKSSKTRESKNAMISSTNPEEPPIARNDNFALIGTGNIYPNTAPPKKYKANNQQDLSLLDRFSGSVYKVEYSKPIDEMTSRFKFIYEMLVGNYYEYMDAIKNNQTKIEPKGLRTVLKDLGLDDLAVVSYRTLVSFRVAFEIQLVRAIAENEGKNVGVNKGKTLQKAFDSFMVAYDKSTVDIIINKTKFTPAFIKGKVDEAIKEIVNNNMIATLNDSVANSVSSLFKRYSDFFVAEKIEP
jgi:cobaltochelatase CobS